MKVSIAFEDYCLPDYFGGDSRPWVIVCPTEKGYTSRELRQAILNEFAMGATGGNDPLLSDFIADEKDQKSACKLIRIGLVFTHRASNHASPLDN